MDSNKLLETERDEKKLSHDTRENSTDSQIEYITASVDMQDADIVHHHPNFFVVATSLEKRQSRIDLEEMEAETVVVPAVNLKEMLARGARILTKPLAAVIVTKVAEDDSHQAASAELPAVSRKRRGSTSASTALPSPDARPGIVARLNSLRLPGWLETILVFGILAGSFAAHAINMFNYPLYELDEGTYMMNAWAITRGMISPYAYGYGHPPLAWIQIAGWVQLTGGFQTFGNAINSGRVLMLLMAVGATLLVYLIARHLGASFIICLFGAAIFACSPLSITYQREVLLDNFATFWFLLSLYLIIKSKSHLFYIVGAALSFGVAILSKEVIIILFPALIYMVWLHTDKFQRKFSMVVFIYVVIAMGSSFILMATLKGELFPYSWHLPWDKHAHLSLFDTYLSQIGRGQQQGSIKQSWNAWMAGDPRLIMLGFAAPAFNLLTGWWNRKGLCLALFAATYWILLLRGGVVFDFYIIPLLPIIALNIVFALTTLTRWITKVARLKLVGIMMVACVLVAMVPYGIQHTTAPFNVFTLRPTRAQNEAMVWICANIPRRAVLVVGSTLYVDLHNPGNEGVVGGAPYVYANDYWEVSLDPVFHDTLLESNWDRIDYIVVDAGMLKDIQTYGGNMKILSDALQHSILRVEFKGDDNVYVRIYQVVHKQAQPQV